MYVKNSIQTLKYMNFDINQCNRILKIFKESKEMHNMKEISIFYFVKKEKISIDLAYDILNYLIVINEIEIIQLSICCHCGHENINTNKNIIKCSRCGDVYLNNDLNEKFRLKD